jgi:hypothetical protein
MNHSSLVCIVVFAAALLFDCGHKAVGQVTWDVDNTSSIGGHATTFIGNPTVVETPFGNSVWFDGNDGLIVNANPIAGAVNFTIEMIFRPDPIVNSSSNQPRVLHVQSSIPPDHRATLETRVTADNQHWYFDAFLRSQRPAQTNPSVVNSLTLIDDTKLHSLGRWYNFAMTYDGSQLRAYVDGHEEGSGPLAVLATASGQTSLGMRHNQVNFFEGVIAKARFTPSVVNPADFLSARIAGDFDNNGSVDVADYAKWKADYGTSVPNPGDGADGNGDGFVDAADYTFWRNRLDAAPAGASQTRSVPEPSAILMLACGFVAIGRRVRRRS